ncbi:hypothetical protein [Nocardia cyriacigeorgica]|uniref:hypothetical protein n=1 Tax=Nocardia cyriacigeorgica TaxID=135487 RepID=UPI0013D45D88|nr:hypothetical protein [Nocardia cyriacigeorgica]NEW29399.1 hypothetical protein [Nocardia cyriacigeorgica]
MSVSTYRDDVRAAIYAPHVRELNEYVDTLRAKKPKEFVPHISPEFGGSQARLLLLTLSPGEKTRLEASGGSGLLSVENSDPAAARIAEALDHAGIDRMDCVGWNFYPWYVKGFGELKAQARDPYLHEGVDLPIQVIARLPRLRAVFIFGKVPERGWGLFQQSYPMTARSLKLFHHRSTGPSGYRGTVEQQMRWRRELFEEMNRAAAAIGR